MSIDEICLRDPETIQREIDALEKELESDLAAGKATYKANIIRRDVAALRQDVHILARGIAEIMERQDRHGSMLSALYELRRLERAVPASLPYIPPSQSAE